LTSLGMNFFSSATGVQVVCGILSGVLSLVGRPLVTAAAAGGGLAVPAGGGLAVPVGGGLGAPPAGVPGRRGN
jgi:hypothetical protein